MSPEEIDLKLFTSPNDQYGDKYTEHLLEQYKNYVAATEAVSDRRYKTNEFFLAVNTALVTLLGFIVVQQTSHHTSILALSSVAGIALDYLWYRIIRSYQGLNSGRFKVISIIERRLPLALYDTEWEVLGKGKNRNLYWPFTQIERGIPWIFISIFLVLLFIVTYPLDHSIWLHAYSIVTTGHFK